MIDYQELLIKYINYTGQCTRADYKNVLMQYMAFVKQREKTCFLDENNITNSLNKLGLEFSQEEIDMLRLLEDRNSFDRHHSRQK